MFNKLFFLAEPIILSIAIFLSCKWFDVPWWKTLTLYTLFGFALSCSNALHKKLKRKKPQKFSDLPETTKINDNDEFIFKCKPRTINKNQSSDFKKWIAKLCNIEIELSYQGCFQCPEYNKLKGFCTLKFLYQNINCVDHFLKTQTLPYGMIYHAKDAINKESDYIIDAGNYSSSKVIITNLKTTTAKSFNYIDYDNDPTDTLIIALQYVYNELRKTKKEVKQND